MSSLPKPANELARLLRSRGETARGPFRKALPLDPPAAADSVAAYLRERFADFTPGENWPRVAAVYPAGADPEYLSLIREPTPADPIYQQVAPAEEELSPLGAEDPARETACSPCPRLLHRYPDRVLILAAASCFVRCRHCMRKRLSAEYPLRKK